MSIEREVRACQWVGWVEQLRGCHWQWLGREMFECSEIRDRIRGLDGERTLTDSREVQQMLPTELEYNIA